MTIIEIPQGYYRDVEGTTREAFIAFATARDAEFLKEHPGCAKWHRPSWRELEVKEHQTAYIGYVWYVVDDEGRLKVHSANYDTSG